MSAGVEQSVQLSFFLRNKNLCILPHLDSLVYKYLIKIYYFLVDLNYKPRCKKLGYPASHQKNWICMDKGQIHFWIVCLVCWQH